LAPPGARAATVSAARQPPGVEIGDCDAETAFGEAGCGGEADAAGAAGDDGGGVGG
jgi:hypothetical protein